MLYVYYGTDTIKVRTSAFQRLNELADGTPVHTFTADEYEVGALTSISQSTSLWGGTETILFDTLSDEPAAFEEFVEHIEALARSPHAIVVIEGALTKEVVNALKEHQATGVEYKAVAGERFNPFAMADALAKRDKKSLWLLLTRARDAGLSPEEIIGTLFWQLKALRLAKIAKTASEAGMKDFPFNKARSAARSFTDQDLFDLSESLVTLYHEGHLGTDIDLALEKWVLEV